MEKRIASNISRKAGLDPGTLMHIGDQPTEKPEITMFSYNKFDFKEMGLRHPEDYVAFQSRDHVTWINVDGSGNVEVIGKIGESFNLHNLLLEDILNAEQRPKLEDYGDYIFFTLKMLSYRKEKEAIHWEHVSFVLGENYVLSFQEKEGDVFDPIRERLRQNKGLARTKGADYLVYLLIDIIIDNYYYIIENLGEKMEQIEEAVLAQPSQEVFNSIQQLKKNIIFLRKNILPLREAVSLLEKSNSPLLNSSSIIYFRDVYDHTIHVIEYLETYRDMLSGLMDIYLSSISNKMNEVMKVLTIISTIFIPLTFIVGVYGMNFEFMPELRERWAYPAVWVIMLTIAGAMLMFFRRKKWL